MTCPTAASRWPWPSPCLRGGLAAGCTLPGDAFTFLFSESAARAIVAVRPGAEAEFARDLRAVMASRPWTSAPSAAAASRSRTLS